MPRIVQLLNVWCIGFGLHAGFFRFSGWKVYGKMFGFQCLFLSALLCNRDLESIPTVAMSQ